MVSGTGTGEHRNLGAVQRAGADDHLTAGANSGQSVIRSVELHASGPICSCFASLNTQLSLDNLPTRLWSSSSSALMHHQVHQDHRCTSASSVHQCFIGAPVLHQCTSAPPLSAPVLHQCTSASSVHQCFIVVDLVCIRDLCLGSGPINIVVHPNQLLV